MNAPAGGATEEPLQGLLLEALKALATAGQAELACRLAARACALYRQGDARAWNRFNAAMHRLAAGAPGPTGAADGPHGQDD